MAERGTDGDLILGQIKSFGKMGNRKKLQTFVSGMLAVVGTAILVAGFIVNPRGEIHSSVLIAFGECITFVAAVFGIDYHKPKI